MRIATKKSPPQAISTASMPDIIFLLLIFFMVSTVFREFKGIPVRMPSAVNSMKIDGKRNISYCFVDVNDRISVDDKLLGVKDLTPVMYLKRTNNPRVIISLKVDENCENDIIDKVHKALQEADARRIIYAAKSK